MSAGEKHETSPGLATRALPHCSEYEEPAMVSASHNAKALDDDSTLFMG